MNRRFAIAIAVVLVIAFFAATVAAQAPAQKPAAKGWTVPRTPDGKPDLSGVYSNAQTVPVQRPQNLGAKEFYTAEEVAANAARQRNAKEVGVHYDNSQYGLTAAQSKTAPSLRTSIITGPEGKVPPVTPEAAKRQADRRTFSQEHQWDGPETRPLAERCITWGFEGPPMMPVGYNSNLQIVQGQGYVSVIQEMIHDVRIIPTDGRPHSKVPQSMGDSRGRWEAATLVVDTINYTPNIAIQGAAVSGEIKVTERFTRMDADTVRYQFTVDDPKTWTKPWSGEYNMTKIDSPLYEYACHEGNYGMANNLSGARATERKNATGKK